MIPISSKGVLVLVNPYLAGRTYRRARRSKRGFALLDSVIALTVASLLIVYGLSLMMRTTSSSDAARQTTIAYNMARQQIENVRTFRAAPLPNRFEGPLLGDTSLLAHLNNGSGTLTLATYRGTVKQVTVKIRWNVGARSQTREIAVTSLVAAGGVTP